MDEGNELHRGGIDDPEENFRIHGEFGVNWHRQGLFGVTRERSREGAIITTISYMSHRAYQARRHRYRH